MVLGGGRIRFMCYGFVVLLWQSIRVVHYNDLVAGRSESEFLFSSFCSQYPLCSLLVFDSSRIAIPVAWVITSCDVHQDIHKWLVPLVDRVRTKDARWRPNAFLVDDPSFKTSIIR